MPQIGRRIAAALAVAALITGCSVEPRAVLTNTAGVPIAVRIKARTHSDRDVGDVLVAVAPGHSAELWASRLRAGGLPIVVGGCTYLYPLETGDLERIEADGGGGYPIPVELAADMTLRLKPMARQESRPAPSAFGFPRRPISKTCR